MGRQLKQLMLLVKKNFQILLQRKVAVTFELFLPVVMFFAFSFLRSLMGKESSCMGSYRPIDPFIDIWDDNSDHKIVAMVPNSDFVQDLVDQMLGIPAYQLYNSSNSGGVVTKITLDSVNYITELDAIKNVNNTNKYVVIFPNNTLLEDILESDSGFFKAGIVFDESISDASTDIDYTVRYHQSDTGGFVTWRTELLYSDFDLIAWVGKQLTTPYDYAGYTALQQLIDSSILLLKGAAYIPSIVLRSTPTPGYTSDLFVVYLQPALVPLTFLIGCMIMASSVATDIIEEKCSKMREIMRMMGLSDKTMWAGWFIQRLLFVVVLSVLNTIVLTQMGYFPNSDGTFVFVYIFLFYLAFTVFLFFLTTFQHNVKSASFAMLGLTYLSYLPYDIKYEDLDSMSVAAKQAMSIFPLSGVLIGMKTISNWESIGTGAQWSNIGEGISSIMPFSMGDVMVMFVVDIILYGFLAWYIENVFPGEFGIPNKFYFFLTPSYWGFGSSKTKFEANGEATKYEDPTCHEKVPGGLTAGIQIHNLNKTFSTLDGPKVAVNQLSMEMFQGQITALLGHNGAGKTTTLNMLTGMYPPTSGSATVAGHSIVDDIEGVRGSMGVCPQHNILFKMMTVQQHLDFFIRLKGIDDETQIKKEIDYMLEALGIEDKRNTISHKLSGGMKRKLSVGIALSGGSKIVMLDEPSTGMDVSGKRELWDMLLKMKDGRTIIITTHSMDEADLLGDRIAIMAAGDLVCSGSSMFLKRRYGVGYHLTLVKTTADMLESEIENLTTFLKSHVPSATLNSNVGSELSYLLHASEVPRFVKLFQLLEEDSENYGIANFGVSLTTMEEVFMKAGEGHDSNVKAIKDDSPSDHKIRKFDHGELNSGPTLIWQQFKCQLKKRFILSKRNKLLTLAQLIAPIFFIILGLSTYISLEAVEDGLPISISLKDYPSSTVKSKLYFADMRTNAAEDYADSIKEYMTGSLDVNFKDITSNSTSLIGSYGGTDEECCANSFLQLNASCIEGELGLSNFTTCYDSYPDSEFTYYACRKECFSYECGDEECGDCTVKETPKIPIVEDVDEELNYYQNYFLGLADQHTGSFYVDVQGGLTLSDRSSMYRIRSADNTIVYQTDVSTDNAVMLGDTEDVITGWISYDGIHLLPAFQSAISNTLFLINELDTRVTITNEPLPETLAEASVAEAEESSMVLLSFYLFGTAFLLAAFSQVPVEERTAKSKHLQQISGVNSNVYWLAMLCWDATLYFIINFVIFILIQCFAIDGLSGSRAGPFFLLLFLSGFACIPLVYVLSHLFAKNTTAFGVITSFMFMFTLVGYIMYSIVYGLYETEESELKSGESNKFEWIKTVDVIFLVHPPYAVVAGMNNLMSAYSKEETYTTCTDAYPAMYCVDYKPVSTFCLYETGIGRHVIALLLASVLWMGLLLTAESKFFKLRAALMKLKHKIKYNPAHDKVSEAEDENVTAERNKVDDDKANLIATEGLVMHNLHRQYGNTTAVQNLSLSIAKGECFGLLGVNGAGKTTTFNMMTGDTVPSRGEGYLHGYNITTHLREAQRYIGYCPQFDALIGYLTGRELLAMFANLRGVPYQFIDESVEEIVRMFNLEDHADKECRSYSGGNKRKLSTGIAIIGSPPLIFLDEPTAGMDPTARRFLWDVLCYLRAAGCSIVLTSHSMEECEALCTKISIMVNGASRCLGSIQELKSRYSQGYTVCVLVEPADQTAAMNFIDEKFEGAVLKESYPGYLMYSLGVSYKWSYIFEQLENNKTDLKLLDYSVSQTSLEQVFLNFAKEQRPEKKKKSFSDKFKCCRKKKYVVPEKEIRMSLKRSFVSQNASVEFEENNVV